MSIEKDPIQITINYKGETHKIQTHPDQYHSLMTLISDHLAIPGFGLCCGMGSCGTCMVQIGSRHSEIKRTVFACSTAVNDDLANTDIIVPYKIY